MFKWKLDRPLAVFDLEATGTAVRADRIVELAVVTLAPDGTRQSRMYRVNPEMPIPIEASRIHGIHDDDVANCPTFKEIAEEVRALFDGCDLGGYNIIRFDIPMLTEEFARADLLWQVEGRRIIDAQRIFHKREPRDLSAALRFFCGEMHMDAHGAEADVLATVRVFEGQFERYTDLPQDMETLHAYCNPKRPGWVDSMGRLKWTNDEVVLNFSKKKGTPLRTVIEEDPGFIKWMLRSDFPRDTLAVVQNAVDGKWPAAPTAEKDAQPDDG